MLARCALDARQNSQVDRLCRGSQRSASVAPLPDYPVPQVTSPAWAPTGRGAHAGQQAFERSRRGLLACRMTGMRWQESKPGDHSQCS